MSAKELLEVLQKQNELYCLLIDLSKKMKEEIIKNDIKKIDEIVKLEVALTMKFSVLEKQRKQIIRKLCKEIDKDGSQITLKELKEHFKDEDIQVVEEIEKGIRKAVEDLERINQTNNLLIKNKLEWIDLTVNVLERTMEESDREIKIKDYIIDETI